MTELRASGVESETDLAFAGLTELLGAVIAEIRNLPAPQRDALQSALVLRAEPANPLAVRVALLTLLATLAERAPLLVTVDDAHWLDESSLRALAFAARRFLAERVAFIIAARGDGSGALGFDGHELMLTGLADDEARELLTGRTELNRGAADALIGAAAGNPLALLELPDVIDPHFVAGSLTPLPVGPCVSQALHDRLDQLPESTRLAVGVVAAEGALGYDRVVGAFRVLALEEDALLPAERAGIVTVLADRVQMHHPLLRSVAYHSLSGPDRRRVHAALADVFARPTDHERSVWHRAAATIEPDEDVAVALEGAAIAAEHRGAVATAAHGFARAASLSPNDDDRARRLLASGERWDAAGQWDAALAALEEATMYALDPGLQADIAGSRGRLEVYRSGPEKGAQVLVEAADRIERDDRDAATRLLTYAVSAATFATDADQAVALADRVAHCGSRAGGIHTIEAAFARGTRRSGHVGSDGARNARPARTARRRADGERPWRRRARLQCRRVRRVGARIVGLRTRATRDDGPACAGDGTAVLVRVRVDRASRARMAPGSLDRGVRDRDERAVGRADRLSGRDPRGCSRSRLASPRGSGSRTKLRPLGAPPSPPRPKAVRTRSKRGPRPRWVSWNSGASDRKPRSGTSNESLRSWTEGRSSNLACCGGHPI